MGLRNGQPGRHTEEGTRHIGNRVMARISHPGNGHLKNDHKKWAYCQNVVLEGTSCNYIGLEK
jgi:hypothetical protein